MRVKLNFVKLDPQIDQLINSKPFIQEYKAIVTEASKFSTKTHYVVERYEFLINDNKEITLMENNGPSSHKEVLKNSESELCIRLRNLKWIPCLIIKYDPWLIHIKG